MTKRAALPPSEQGNADRVADLEFSELDPDPEGIGFRKPEGYCKVMDPV